MAPLNIAELRAMALVMSSGSTISSTKAWRAGASNALAVPSRKAMTRMCHGWIQWRKVKAATAKASSIMTVWVIMSRVRRGMRSAMTPA
jgi:hypothetical protein